MKKLCFLLLLTPLLLAMTCDDNYEPVTGLGGRWNLINVSNEFAGSSFDFEENAVTWDFEENTNRIIIMAKREAEAYPGPEGNYNYTFGTETEVCEFTLIVNNIDYGCIEISNDTLTVSKSYLDGDIYTFIR